MITITLTSKEISLLRNALGITYKSKIKIIDSNETQLSHRSMVVIQRDADKYLSLNKSIKKQYKTAM